MTDQFPAIALGDCLDESQAIILPYVCESAVTKGQMVVANTHATGSLPTVSTAGAAAANALGMALQSGSAGEVINVCMLGVCKGTDSGGVTVGIHVVTGASGVLVTVGANTFEKVVGRALQTMADTDTGLYFINCTN